jgi:hypothetical protein
MEHQTIQLEEILAELGKVRTQTAEIAKKVSGPTLKIVRLLGGTVVPLIQQSVGTLGALAGQTELRLQRLEAHVHLIDDDSAFDGLPMNPIDLVNSIMIISEIASQSEFAKGEPEALEMIEATRKAVLEWKEYLLEEFEAFGDDETEGEDEGETEDEGEEKVSE